MSLPGAETGDWQGARGAWLCPADGMPDDDATVLLRVDCGECPLCLGFRDAGDWRDASAALIEAPVLGWAPLHWAAYVLDDTAKVGRSRP